LEKGQLRQPHWPHRRIAYSQDRVDRLRRRYAAFLETHGYKPWKFYKRRDRWMPLPPDIARRG
jgi:hypothetical protein